MTQEEGAQSCEIKDITKGMIGQRVAFNGWVYKVQELATKMFFIVHAGGYYVKCLADNNNKIQLTKNTSVRVIGEVKENYTKKDKYECEVHVTEVKVYGALAPALGIDMKNTAESVLLDNAHILIREPERAAVLKVRAEILRIVREHYYKEKYTEITPPTMVQTQVEGGSTLFEFDYYGEKAYLTQSSQFYLETTAPVFDKVYCIASSYRAEKSNTRRHLSEYTHIEAEMAWIDFEQLMSEIEDLIIAMVKGYNERCVPIIRHYELEAKEAPVPQKPFKRISHKEGIDILRADGITKEDGSEFTYLDDIPDAPERHICDKVAGGMPMFLTRFPEQIKSFYMEKYGDGLTNSCDLLYPGVGEVVGGSMRMWNIEEIRAALKKEGMDEEPYKFYTDLSKYGPTPHGGFGLGLERMIMALMPELVPKVRFACLFPRFNGRCTP